MGSSIERHGSKEKKRKQKKKNKKSTQVYDTVNLNLRSVSSLTPDREERRASPPKGSEASLLKKSESRKVLKSKTALKKMNINTAGSVDGEMISAKKKKKTRKGRTSHTHLEIHDNTDDKADANAGAESA